MSLSRKLGPSALFAAIAAAHLLASAPATGAAPPPSTTPTTFRPSWIRQIDFAKALGAHRYFDLAKNVLGRLEADCGPASRQLAAKAMIRAAWPELRGFFWSATRRRSVWSPGARSASNITVRG